MKKHTFLIEIGTEELPSKILKRLAQDFSYQINDSLIRHDIDCVDIHWFASPRHLAVKSIIKIKKNMFFDDFKKYNDSLKRSYGFFNVSRIVDMNNNRNLITLCDAKKTCEYIKNKNKDYKLQNTLCNVVSLALSKLKNYNMMRWGVTKTPFIRPVHTMIILLDEYLIQGCFFGIDTDRVLYGHRCIKENRIIIHHADSYPEILYKKGKVVVDYGIRREMIRSAVEKEALKIGGVVNIQKNNDLLDEVTSLVEWPIVLSGQFDSKFLKLPSEIIYYIIKCNQKYFPVYSLINGALLPYFIFVVNVITENYKQIIVEHENVIKPRLMDAEFFLKKDDQYRLEDYIPKLDFVLFHKNLGTLRDKSYRIQMLSGWVASQIGEDVQQAKRAGYLCKCDLVSNMVCEFPYAQGIIGMYYARRDAELDQVSLALKEHYNPKFFADVLPTTNISCIVAISDRMDTISGIFGMKELPKSNRDPFALKRCAFGILRILIQKRLSLNLSDLINASVKLYESKLINLTVVEDIHNFLYKRLYSWYYMKNFKISIIKAVLAVDCFNILSVDSRIQAVHKFCLLQKKENIKLRLAYKRILNILSDQLVPVPSSENIKNILLKFPEEIELVNQFFLVEEKIKFLLQKSFYLETMILFVTLCDPINSFFDNVVVMDEDKVVRKNRLILLSKINCLFLKIIDFSRLYV